MDEVNVRLEMWLKMTEEVPLGRSETEAKEGKESSSWPYD
jgi:hypothetical protein